MGRGKKLVDVKYIIKEQVKKCYEVMGRGKNMTSNARKRLCGKVGGRWKEMVDVKY